MGESLIFLGAHPLTGSRRQVFWCAHADALVCKMRHGCSAEDPYVWSTPFRCGNCSYEQRAHENGIEPHCFRVGRKYRGTVLSTLFVLFYGKKKSAFETSRSPTLHKCQASDTDRDLQAGAGAMRQWDMSYHTFRANSRAMLGCNNARNQPHLRHSLRAKMIPLVPEAIRLSFQNELHVQSSGTLFANELRRLSSCELWAKWAASSLHKLLTLLSKAPPGITLSETVLK